MRPHSAARMEGSAARTLRTHDMVPRANASSQPASSSCSKRPAPGPMVWTRMLRAGQRWATSAKPSAIDCASVMSTETPKASGRPAASRASTVSSSACATPGHHGDAGAVRRQHLGHGPAHALAASGHDRGRVSQS